MQEIPHIPYDMYESSQELLIIMPLGGVKKESLSLKIEDYKLLIEGERSNPEVKENLVSIREECYWGKLHQIIDLPAQIYFEKIHSKLTPENTLQIIIPKALVQVSFLSFKRIIQLFLLQIHLSHFLLLPLLLLLFRGLLHLCGEQENR